MPVSQQNGKTAASYLMAVYVMLSTFHADSFNPPQQSHELGILTVPITQMSHSKSWPKVMGLKVEESGLTPKSAR